MVGLVAAWKCVLPAVHYRLGLGGLDWIEPTSDFFLYISEVIRPIGFDDCLDSLKHRVVFQKCPPKCELAFESKGHRYRSFDASKRRGLGGGSGYFLSDRSREQFAPLSAIEFVVRCHGFLTLDFQNCLS